MRDPKQSIPGLAPVETVCLVSRSAAETRRWGRVLASFLRPGDIVCLVGDLGSGKTCFTQGLGQGLGVAQPIVSPTFIRAREYQNAPGHLPLYHIDLYRVPTGEEALAWGLEEYLYGDAVCAIEWADRAEKVLPCSCLWIHLEHADEAESRRICFRACAERGRWLLKQIKEEIREA